LYIGGRLFAAHKTSAAPVVNVAAAANGNAMAPARFAPAPAAAPVTEAQAVLPARPTPAPDSAASPAAAALPAPPASLQVEPAKASVDPVRKLVNPQPNELYLQLAALGPKALDHYVPELQAQGVRAVIAPGPEATVFRVLVGPYATRDEMSKAGKELEAKGIESMPRVY
jgi:cell division septation protein DedD